VFSYLTEQNPRRERGHSESRYLELQNFFFDYIFTKNATKIPDLIDCVISLAVGVEAFFSLANFILSKFLVKIGFCMGRKFLKNWSLENSDFLFEKTKFLNLELSKNRFERHVSGKKRVTICPFLGKTGQCFFKFG